MNIAVCEDNSGDKAVLCAYVENYLARMGYAGEVHCFATGEELLQAFAPGMFSILFLDIYLPGQSGVDVARAVRAADPTCLIIFITTSMDHAMDGFEVQASGYVVKPIDQGKMDKALYMCREVLAKTARTITVPNGRSEPLSLPVVNIQYVEVYGKAAVFHMNGGMVETRLPLDSIEKALGGEPFLRCHRSYVVNMNYVREVGDADFVMQNGAQVPMRKNGRKEVKIAFARFVAGRRLEGVRP